MPQQDQKTHSHGVRRHQEFCGFRRNPEKPPTQKKLENRKYPQKITTSRSYVKPLIRLYGEMGKVHTAVTSSETALSRSRSVRSRETVALHKALSVLVESVRYYGKLRWPAQNHFQLPLTITYMV